MAYSKGILLGKITRVIGFEGAVAVRLERGFSEKIPDMGSVFLEIEGKPVPFFIEYSEYSGGDILKFKFEGYSSPDQSGEFVGCHVFMTSSGEEITDDGDPEILMGYSVLTTSDIMIGTITGVIPNPAQILLSVDTDSGRNILIPLHQDLIVKIDRKKKQLKMNIPVGLLEIN
jgi:16S rRNA processing protein RimM